MYGYDTIIMDCYVVSVVEKVSEFSIEKTLCTTEYNVVYCIALFFLQGVLNFMVGGRGEQSMGEHGMGEQNMGDEAKHILKSANLMSRY